MKQQQVEALVQRVARFKEGLNSDTRLIVEAVETTERLRWSAVAEAMFAADQRYGCGFYNDDEWVAAYKTLAEMAGVKCGYSGDL